MGRLRGRTPQPPACSTPTVANARVREMHLSFFPPLRPEAAWSLQPPPVAHRHASLGQHFHLKGPSPHKANPFPCKSSRCYLQIRKFFCKSAHCFPFFSCTRLGDSLNFLSFSQLDVRRLFTVEVGRSSHRVGQNPSALPQDQQGVGVAELDEKMKTSPELFHLPNILPLSECCVVRHK
jgi:hypothetical protein